MSGISKQIREIFDWKTWTIIGFGGTTVVLGTALVSQWDDASLGRQVSRNVKRFLKDTGSQIGNGMISGGKLKTPMKVNTAVNALIVQLLNEAFDDIERRGPTARPGKDDDIEYPTYTSQAPPKSPGRKQQVAAIEPSAPAAIDRMASERKKRRTTTQCLEVSKIMRDDGGYGQSGDGRRGSGKRSKATFEYNVDEFNQGRPSGKCPRRSVFTDDEGGGDAEGGDDDEYE